MTVLESGDSLTVTNSFSSARDREPNRPYLLSNPNKDRGERTFFQYFNTAAFADPGQDVKGNAGSGIVRGPGVANWDIAIAKQFRLYEKLRFDFRADMFNAFNHTQWAGVNTGFTLASGNIFGRVTGAREARVIQFLLKVAF